MHKRHWISRLSANLFIACYVSCLAWGVAAHALKMGLSGNTLSYYVVWDMFCGWQAYDNRTHLIAEGRSGQYYDLRAPWGEFCPFGSTARIHYDVSNRLVPKHIRNVLKHTTHEPIDRVYVVQEIWPKQFNIPDRLWGTYFEEPCERISYFNLRAICSESGSVLNSYPDWYARQTMQSISDNPRLQLAARRAQPFINTFASPVRDSLAQSPSFESVGGEMLNTN